MKDTASEPGGLFDDAVMAEIAKMAMADADKVEISILQAKLRSIGEEYRRVISITPSILRGAPSSHTLTQRLDWVDANLLNPIDRLLEALDPENRHLLSLWPEEPDPELIPDYDDIAKRLGNLQLLGQNLAIILAKYRHHDLQPGPMIRYNIVAAVATALDEALPSLRPSRGTFDPDSKRFYGPYPEVMRRIFQEITGTYEQLDALIKEQVDERRK